MMKQYFKIKEANKDSILFFRLGDFYEMFFDDAKLASKELELTLTARDGGDGKRAAMWGVPFHKADVYVGKLVEKGYKVAICEQTEDPKSAVGLVKREVVRVVTPGTITDGSLLAEGKNNFLLSVCYGQGGVALGFADISTGEISSTFIQGEEQLTRIENEIAAYQPSEAIIKNPKQGDITLNVCKAKHLTSIRSKGADEALILTPPKIMSLEQAIEFIVDDELIEVTPKSIRLRKRILNTELRLKAEAKIKRGQS